MRCCWGDGHITHAEAFEPMRPGDPFGDMMNAPKKYVVSKTLERPIWRDTTIIQPGKTIATDGSSQLVHALFAHDLVDELHLLVYPLTLGAGNGRCRTGCTRRSRSSPPRPIRPGSWAFTMSVSGRRCDAALTNLPSDFRLSHPERSEGGMPQPWPLRFAQGDSGVLDHANAASPAGQSLAPTEVPVPQHVNPR
jgi:hypothetical protein